MVPDHPDKDETWVARESSVLNAASDIVLGLKKTKDVVCIRAFCKQRLYQDYPMSEKHLSDQMSVGTERS